MKRISLFAAVIALGILISCGETASDSDKQTGTKDSAGYSGLEGTRDQAGRLSTDVKQDTSGGQANNDMKSQNDSSGKSMASNGDDDFLKEQVEGNYDELTIAKLASTKSSDKEIKSIATSLVDDHSKALDKLRNMAGKNNIKVASAPSDGALKTVSILENKKPGNFDKAWCETLIDKHKKTIEKYESQARSVSDKELKSFINETLPKLRMHLDKLMAYHGQVKS